jgi:hypothetical protein
MVPVDNGLDTRTIGAPMLRLILTAAAPAGFTRPLRAVMLALAALAAACTTKPVPGVCCIGAEDCGRLGLAEDRPCPAGQACVDLQCAVASCSNQGCPDEAPVCGDDGACRGCRLDAECPSGACGDGGACAAENNIVYLAPAGQNVAPCTRDAPCSGLQFGIRQTNGSRSHVVMAPGTYTSDAGLTIRIDPQHTLASSISIHGGGSTLMDGGAETLLVVRLPTSIRDLQIEYDGTGIFAAAETRLERVRITAANGIQGSSLKARDVSFRTTSTAITVDGTLDLDRGIISGGTSGVRTSSLTSFQISNLLVHGTSDVALDLQGGTGVVSFATIADTGINSTSASGISCPTLSQGPAIRSSIIWTPGATRPAITGSGCSIVSTIAGPVGVVGAMNVDPSFVNPQGSDYHLNPNSPARDMVDSGPGTDFEGDPRPGGARFDIGADEAR